MTQKTVYFDTAASMPISDDVKKVMLSFLDSYQLNPSSTYANQEKHQLNELRTKAATVLQVKPHEIIFTAGATEANNILIHGVMTAFPNSSIAISPLEHDSIQFTAQGYDTVSLPIDASGQLDLSLFASQIDDNVALASIIFVSNETGIIQPLKKIARQIELIRIDRRQRGVKTPLIFHSDAAQAQYLGFFPKSLGLDAMTLNGSKLGGPKQSGCLYLARDVHIEPVMYGGNQERGLRPGTEALHQIAGFVAALESAQNNRENNYNCIQSIQEKFETGIKNLGGQVIGDKSLRSPHISSVVLASQDNERMSFKLESRGILVGTGSACHATTGKPSTALRALGYTDKDARSTLRFSFSPQSSKHDVEYVLKTLQELL